MNLTHQTILVFVFYKKSYGIISCSTGNDIFPVTFAHKQIIGLGGKKIHFVNRNSCRNQGKQLNQLNIVHAEKEREYELA